MTRVLVVGAGSIGTRHARVLAAAGADVAVCDPDPARATAAGARVVDFHPGQFGGYDAVVIASPSVFHLEQARAALRTSARVLVEKPLATCAAGLDDLADEAGARLMVAYNLRCHAPVARVMELVHGGRAGRVLGARLWFGSWLPDWRPGSDYRHSYSARADLGGGILLDAIHELDLLLWLFGDDRFEVLGAEVGRAGPLAIDVEDTVKAVLRHATGVPVDVSLDYLSRRYRRGIEVVGDVATIRLDWARRVIEIEDADDVVVEPARDPVDRSYEVQARRFLAVARGEAAPLVDARTGAQSVRLADRIRAAGR